MIVTSWFGRLLNVTVVFAPWAPSKTKLASLTSPVALIVPVPVSWLGDAHSPGRQRPTVGAEVDCARAAGRQPTYVVPPADTAPPLVMFNDPLPW